MPDESEPFPSDTMQRAALVKQKARSLGFDAVGIASAEASRYREHLRQWIDAGRSGEMAYLHERFEERVDPKVYLPGAMSVICVSMNYQVDDAFKAGVDDHADDHGSGGLIPSEDELRIARYARAIDYHTHIKPRLYAIADWLREKVPGTTTRCGVDTAPVMERELATRAGIGWVGKNTMLIHPRIGSFTFLGEVLTSLALPTDEAMPDRCGTCQRCIEACPTQCIEPYTIDASRCISYLTIERQSDFDKSTPGLSGWLFGCDVCQDVCPYNGKAPLATDEKLRPRLPAMVGRTEVLSWDEERYWSFTRHTPVRRVKLPQLQRNARHA